MRRSIVPFSGMDLSIHARSLADFITTTCGFRFSVHTRAVREFTAESVDEKTLRQLIDAAIQAPSAVNEQPWLFSVVLNKELLSRISHEAKTHMVKTTPAGLLSHSRHFQEILNDPTSLS